jgi:hypothetical protein
VLGCEEGYQRPAGEWVGSSGRRTSLQRSACGRPDRTIRPVAPIVRLGRGGLNFLSAPRQVSQFILARGGCDKEFMILVRVFIHRYRLYIDSIRFVHTIQDDRLNKKRMCIHENSTNNCSDLRSFDTLYANLRGGCC